MEYTHGHVDTEILSNDSSQRIRYILTVHVRTIVDHMS